MILEGIEYPNDLINAIQNDTLVVFAGAGVSKEPPTNLPNFVELTKYIASGTSRKVGREPCEVFLGSLKANAIDVNDLAARALSNACLQHNKHHEVILNLFLSSRSIRIITTNYDQMFEQVLQDKEINVHVYDSPALPLGNDFSGIVHIHGNVKCPKYMVLTDEDFGRAYLTDGYVSRFLKSVFDSYTVLFIGYSYNDTIIRYLTRAMSRDGNNKRYILTDDKGTQWDIFGIIPLFYPKNEHQMMRESLEKVGARAKRGLLEWKEWITSISDAPPKDFTVDSEVEYCLENVERTQVLANAINGAMWVEYLDEKGVFDRLFNSTNTFDGIDRVWCRWLSEKILGNEDNCFRMLLFKHGNCVNEVFAQSIIHRLMYKDFPERYFKEYIILLENHIRDNVVFLQLVYRANEKNQHTTCFFLYKKLWTICFSLTYKDWERKCLEARHSFLGDEYTVSETWKVIEEHLTVDDARNLLVFFKLKMEELHEKYCEAGLASQETDPLNLRMMEIEEREEYLNEDILRNLVAKMIHLSKLVMQGDPDFIKLYATDGLKSDSLFARKVFLKLLREIDVFTADEKYKLILDTHVLPNKAYKEQVFLLIADLFNEFSEGYKNNLIDYIEAIPGDDQSSEYEKYNWCVWIKRVCNNNSRINALEKEILSRNDYKPQLFPERTYIISSSEGERESMESISELKNWGYRDAIQYLLDVKKNGKSGPEWWGLLDVFSEIVSKDYIWASKTVALMNKKHVNDRDVWEHVFQGTCVAQYSIEDRIHIIRLLNEGDVSSTFLDDLSNLCWVLIQDKGYKNTHQTHEKEMLDLLFSMWKRRPWKTRAVNRVIDSALNSVEGLILYSLIYLLSYNDVKIIDNKYKTIFEEALSLRGNGKQVAVCVLAGHFNLLYYKDNKWCKEHFVKILKGRNKTSFNAAWEGFVFFSRSIPVIHK